MTPDATCYGGTPAGTHPGHCGGSLPAPSEPEDLGVGSGWFWYEEEPVITAIVFVQADVAQIPEVAEQIAALEGVSEVYSVTGEIDLIAMVRVRHHEQIAEVVADRLNKVPGVLGTETHIAFRTFSTHDLEAAFALGVDDPD